jgi:hypothetical protein
MRRLSNFGKSVLDKALTEYHNNKKQNIYTYFELLEDLEYVLKEFFNGAKELKTFVENELNNDDLFLKTIKSEYGLSYAGVIGRLEITTPKIIEISTMNIYTPKKGSGFKIDEILKDLDIAHKIASRKILLNRTFLEPKQVPLKLMDIDVNKIHQVRSASIAMLLKKEIIKFHKNKEVFLYSFTARLEYLNDILLSFKEPVQNLNNFALENELYDKNTRKMLLVKFGLDYAPINKLQLNLTLSIKDTLSDMSASISHFREYLNRKIEVNEYIVNRNKQTKSVQPVEVSNLLFEKRI